MVPERSTAVTVSAVKNLQTPAVQTNGFSFFVEDHVESDHRIDVKTDAQNTLQTMIIPYAVTASGVVADSGRRLSLAMGVRDAYMKIFTAGTSVTIDVGTSTLGNSGFIAGVTTDTTGWRAVSEGASAGLGVKGPGISVAATATTNGLRLIHIPANATSGLTITYQMTTAGAQSPNGYIYLEYSRLPAL